MTVKLKNSFAICLIIMLISSFAATSQIQIPSGNYDDYYKYYYNKGNKKVKTIHYNSFYQRQDSVLYLYKTGLLVCEKFFKSQGVDSVCYNYDKTGKLTKKYRSDIKTEVVYEYNKTGKPAYKFERQKGLSKLDTIAVYIYDSKDRLIFEKTKIKTRSQLIILQYYKYTYGVNNKLINIRSLQQNGSLKETDYKYYNKKGNISKRLVYDSKKILKDSIQYIYDSKDSLVQVLTYTNTVLTRKQDQQYSDNKLIFTESYFNINDGELSSFYKTIETYDAKHRIIEKATYDNEYIEIEIFKKP